MSGYSVLVNINVVTMFPQFFDSPLEVSLIGRAQRAGVLHVAIIDLRDYGIGPHRQLDDAPFGGGPGMIMMVEPLTRALANLAATNRILLTPAGATLSQAALERWSEMPELTVVCGRYEGVDERVADNYIDEEVSLGDYVLLGGEVGALAIIEGVTRLIDGVLGNPQSARTESFSEGLLEEPQYTRPAHFEGTAVPEVLLSGDHARIAQWRDQQRRQRTAERRRDLLQDDGLGKSPQGG
jgi:tRNA (guanine37-N1)-methyltransferase